MGSRLRLATINTNGIRAAFRKGMGSWLEGRDVDILAIQEVRASTDDIQGLLGPEWNVVHDEATAKGRAGVALASRRKAEIHRIDLGPKSFDSAGRWLEADYDVNGTIVTVVSTYVHSGEADTPKQDEKWKFLDAMSKRLPQLEKHNELAVVVGDLNVGHTPLDIKNWKGNVKRAGFLPRERAYFDRFFGPRGQEGRGRRRLERQGPRLGRRGSPGRGRRRGAVHLVVVARRRVRQRHRLAHRLPDGDPGTGREGEALRGRPRPSRTTSDGPTTLPSSSTTTSESLSPLFFF